MLSEEADARAVHGREPRSRKILGSSLARPKPICQGESFIINLRAKDPRKNETEWLCSPGRRWPAAPCRTRGAARVAVLRQSRVCHHVAQRASPLGRGAGKVIAR